MAFSACFDALFFARLCKSLSSFASSMCTKTSSMCLSAISCTCWIAIDASWLHCLSIGSGPTMPNAITISQLWCWSKRLHANGRSLTPGTVYLSIMMRLLQHHNCDIVMALGMVGPEPIDKQCSHEASMAIQQVQLMADRHILEVFVHMDE